MLCRMLCLQIRPLRQRRTAPSSGKSSLVSFLFGSSGVVLAATTDIGLSKQLHASYRKAELASFVQLEYI